MAAAGRSLYPVALSACPANPTGRGFSCSSPPKQHDPASWSFIRSCPWRQGPERGDLGVVPDEARGRGRAPVDGFNLPPELKARWVCLWPGSSLGKSSQNSASSGRKAENNSPQRPPRPLSPRCPTGTPENEHRACWVPQGPPGTPLHDKLVSPRPLPESPPPPPPTAHQQLETWPLGKKGLPLPEPETQILSAWESGVSAPVSLCSPGGAWGLLLLRSAPRTPQRPGESVCPSVPRDSPACPANGTKTGAAGLLPTPGGRGDHIRAPPGWRASRSGLSQPARAPPAEPGTPTGSRAWAPTPRPSPPTPL
ncbi:proline-rich receptor-like protein kinase PERK2 [Felis catus]|uniref:proline-rich receptor-like protein kinase PERK2 n=1 Tax=Felis catus TaxID=9685 RepID=UPI001D19AC46|nr:proline-rich receptor-like protein kinase PERK2 [Felis catus]XP_044892472.1 proline-rich receptor-like protein kinase PERK2 [Felis catus]XP_044892473.1 proline-rich receptor-like protein kinase PERK2 [Felis catus]XP_044892474.1 proline-rich receptor-like protein kinase PERK2 [Felis catus]XP_044892475.1 proline-rich receptor-like protein kinase PERK2 [Felis catus]